MKVLLVGTCDLRRIVPSEFAPFGSRQAAVQRSLAGAFFVPARPPGRVSTADGVPAKLIDF
jgi:hypothetical protein